MKQRCIRFPQSHSCKKQRAQNSQKRLTAPSQNRTEQNKTTSNSEGRKKQTKNAAMAWPVDKEYNNSFFSLGAPLKRSSQGDKKNER